jgi:hypothetical protein
MTMRERMLALVHGRKHDRVPFVQYSGIGAPNEEIWTQIGRDSMGLLQWTAIHSAAHPNCRMVTEDIAKGERRGTRTRLVTPAGELTEEKFHTPTLGSAAIHKHFVTEPEDYRVLTAFVRDTVITPNHDQVLQVRKQLGEDGLPLVSVGRTPYQQLWVQWVSLEDLSCHLVDCPELVQECTDEMGRILRDIFACARNAPIDMIDVADNITAPTIGVANFRKYCVPFYDELADMLSDRDIPVFVHMDGDLKPLWGAIGESKVRGIDSLAPPPDNDTSVGEAARLWPEMRLWVNFPSSVHARKPEVIYAEAAKMLVEAGDTGRLQIQVSENPPPGAWRTSYPEIVRAISDFGAPACAA